MPKTVAPCDNKALTISKPNKPLLPTTMAFFLFNLKLIYNQSFIQAF